MAGDGIRLRGGNREGMPRLADREPAYVRDEEALYIGTAGGNVRLAAAGTEPRVTALENAARTHADTLSAHGEGLENHQGRLSALEQTDTVHAAQLTEYGDTLAARGKTLENHQGRLSALEQADTVHAAQLGEHTGTLAAHGEVLTDHGKTLESLGGRLSALEEESAGHGKTLIGHAAQLTEQAELLDRHSDLLESMEGVQQTQQEGLERLQAEKLTAAPMAALPALAADAALPAVTEAWNTLIAALKAAGMMQE